MIHLEAKRHQERYERRSYMLQITKQDRDNVFRDKIAKKLSFTDVFRRLKCKKQRTTNLFGSYNAASNLRVRSSLEAEMKTVTIV